MKTKGLNDYLNTFRDTAVVKEGYSIGNLHVVVVDKSDLLRILIDSDVESSDISIGLDMNGKQSLCGEISNGKLKTAIRLLEKKAKDGTRIDDFVAFNQIQTDIGKIKEAIKQEAWKKKEED